MRMSPKVIMIVAHPGRGWQVYDVEVDDIEHRQRVSCIRKWALGLSISSLFLTWLLPLSIPAVILAALPSSRTFPKRYKIAMILSCVALAITVVWVTVFIIYLSRHYDFDAKRLPHLFQQNFIFPHCRNDETTVPVFTS